MIRRTQTSTPVIPVIPLLSAGELRPSTSARRLLPPSRYPCNPYSKKPSEAVCRGQLAGPFTRRPPSPPPEVYVTRDYGDNGGPPGKRSALVEGRYPIGSLRRPRYPLSASGVVSSGLRSTTSCSLHSGGPCVCRRAFREAHPATFGPRRNLGNLQFRIHSNRRTACQSQLTHFAIGTAS